MRKLARRLSCIAFLEWTKDSTDEILVRKGGEGRESLWIAFISVKEMPPWIDHQTLRCTSVFYLESLPCLKCNCVSPSYCSLGWETRWRGKVHGERNGARLWRRGKIALRDSSLLPQVSHVCSHGDLARSWREFQNGQLNHLKVERDSTTQRVTKISSGGWKTSAKPTRTVTEIVVAREAGVRPKAQGRRRAGRSGKMTGYWRVFRVEVLLDGDLGKDNFDVSDGLLEATASALGCSADMLPRTALLVIRKSFDARKDPRFVYTVEMDIGECLRAQPGSKAFLSRLHERPGKLEFSRTQRTPSDLISHLRQSECVASNLPGSSQCNANGSQRDGLSVDEGGNEAPKASSLDRRRGEGRPRVVVVGSGPAGLFAALVLAETGVQVTLVERGQPVETRGRDIGALMVRRLLHPESNLCFGEGGAGTWSDGKLTTRIGKNSGSVQTVLATLVRFGAPAHILMDGKPHIGTDRLIRILQAFREHLLSLGVNIMFGTRMDDLIVRNGRVVGVRLCPVMGKPEHICPGVLEADAVVLGVGHSARDVYESLLSHDVLMTAKDFAVGFRIEHPQELVNEIQYHKWASEVHRGKGRIPVADYKVAADVDLRELKPFSPSDGEAQRGCYSFCMCPGGQVVPTSTNDSELCINGMSFSTRSSKWANAALVVTVPSTDFAHLVADHGPLAGVAFQRAIEREAALRGGGKLVAPVQLVPDFLDDRLSRDGLPLSSYRLGTRAAPLHDLLPPQLTHALKQALVTFDDQLPGFIDQRALLHGVETRTSSPVRIERNKDSFESLTMPGLYPVGEGAGYAGGIVSAAVDGMHAGLCLAKQFDANNALLRLLPSSLS